MRRGGRTCGRCGLSSNVSQQSHKQCLYEAAIVLPMLARPKRRPPLVEEAAGGGFWICDAVGARDWRMEYVRCMLGETVRVARRREAVCGQRANGWSESVE